MNERLPIGATVTWSSQANGGWKTKTGVIEQFLPAGSVAMWRSNNLKFHSRSTRDRYLVRVDPPAGSRAKSKYYTPTASMLERENLS